MQAALASAALALVVAIPAASVIVATFGELAQRLAAVIH